MNKRFSMDKAESDFIQPCKLTRQKRLVEAQKEFVRLEHKALSSVGDGVAVSMGASSVWTKAS